IRHGWTLPPDGALDAVVSSRAIVSSSTGSGRKARIDVRARTASVTFMPAVCRVGLSPANRALADPPPPPARPEPRLQARPDHVCVTKLLGRPKQTVTQTEERHSVQSLDFSERRW